MVLYHVFLLTCFARGLVGWPWVTLFVSSNANSVQGSPPGSAQKSCAKLHVFQPNRVWKSQSPLLLIAPPRNASITATTPPRLPLHLPLMFNAIAAAIATATYTTTNCYPYLYLLLPLTTPPSTPSPTPPPFSLHLTLIITLTLTFSTTAPTSPTTPPPLLPPLPPCNRRGRVRQDLPRP